MITVHHHLVEFAYTLGVVLRIIGISWPPRRVSNLLCYISVINLRVFRFPEINTSTSDSASLVIIQIHSGSVILSPTTIVLVTDE